METKTEKIHWKKVFNKDFLGACDLDDGKDLKVVIKCVEVRDVKNNNGKLEKRNVAIFTDNTKPMILNVSACKLIKKFTGTPYIDEWKNVPIQIYVKNDIQAFGEITEGLRIREVQPKIDKPELTPNTPAWNNAVEYLKGKGSIPQIEKKYYISPSNLNLLKRSVL